MLLLFAGLGIGDGEVILKGNRAGTTNSGGLAFDDRGPRGGDVEINLVVRNLIGIGSKSVNFSQ